jgi:uncharacterized protein YdhG (YjbR/CyaY superfamily)
MMPAKPTTIAEYAAPFPPDIRDRIDAICALVREVAPDAVDTISYSIPAFKLNGKVIVYFAVWKNHVGLYNPPKGDAQFDAMSAPYRAAKGTLQFPLSEQLPIEVIRRHLELSARQVRGVA